MMMIPSISWSAKKGDYTKNDIAPLGSDSSPHSMNSFTISNTLVCMSMKT